MSESRGTPASARVLKGKPKKRRKDHDRQVMIAVGQVFRRRRREREWSTQTLAAKAGIGNTAVWQIEHGRGNPLLSTLSKVATALDLLCRIEIVPEELTNA